jgi:hypothetical protein
MRVTLVPGGQAHFRVPAAGACPETDPSLCRLGRCWNLLCTGHALLGNCLSEMFGNGEAFVAALNLSNSERGC